MRAPCFNTVEMTGINAAESNGTSNGDLKSKKLLHVANGDAALVRKMAPAQPEQSRLESVNGASSIAETEEFDDEDADDEKVWSYAAEIPITEIDERDKGTSDDWIPRHPDLVRLTGRHPFNCEPPLTALMEVRKYTTQSLTQTKQNETKIISH